MFRTQSLESVSHGLVLGHVDKTSAQAEVGEDEEDLLQDPVHFIQVLESTKDNTEFNMAS